MTDTLITTTQTTDLAEPLTIGQIANGFAARGAFEDYRSRRAPNTITRQDNDLALFAAYRAEVKRLADEAGLVTDPLPTSSLATDPDAWEGITWGLVEKFVTWQLQQGFAVSSVNVQLSTVKRYAKLARKAGTLDREEYAMIKDVSGYSHKEGMHIDEARQEAEVPTRFDRPGAKKNEPVRISTLQAKELKSQPDTPQGRRDNLLMALLLDLGLRCGEVAILQVTNFDLKAGELKFYRPKVDKVQTLRLHKDALAATLAYFEQDAPGIGPVLRGSRKGGHLTDDRMSARAITKRVATLGRSIDIEGLSAHDCRHYWATTAARNKTPIDRLRQAGGWKSLAMPMRYIEDAKIANEGVII